MKWQARGKSDIGLCRANNEDNLYLDNRLGLYLVADGMGGVEGGEIASQIIIDELPQLIKNSFDAHPDITSTQFQSRLQENIHSVNDLVYRQGIALGFIGMGATLVLAIVKEQHALIAHIGDSRCYKYHKNRLSQLTHDHVCPDNDHELTQVIGIEEFIESELQLIKLTANTVLLLCSDGLTHMINDKDILTIIQNTPIQKVTQNLIDSAKKAGGEDNITIITIYSKNSKSRA